MDSPLTFNLDRNKGVKRFMYESSTDEGNLSTESFFLGD